MSVAQKILDMRPAWANASECRMFHEKAGMKNRVEHSMRLPVASTALAAALVMTPVAAGYAPALSQDFSITNSVEPAEPGRPDLMRQLQAWWDLRAYYPKHASNNDEGGTVKVHLQVLRDGRIWMPRVVESSGSPSLDAAAAAVFHSGFVRPLPDGAPEADLDISLHYVLAHRHDQPVPVGYTPGLSKRPFTIMNDPVKSPILDTMLQRTCTGTVARGGIRNHPAYGLHNWAQAVFFRRPDGTPWVQFYEAGLSVLAPVTEVGKMVQWTGPVEHLGKAGGDVYLQYAVWPDGDDTLSGNVGVFPSVNIGIYRSGNPGAAPRMNAGGYIDLTCAKEVVPAIKWSGWSVTPGETPPADPP